MITHRPTLSGLLLANISSIDLEYSSRHPRMGMIGLYLGRKEMPKSSRRPPASKRAAARAEPGSRFVAT